VRAYDQPIQKKQAEGWGLGSQLAGTKSPNATSRDGPHAERRLVPVGVLEREYGFGGDDL
jgi:hypothetical protein